MRLPILPQSCTTIGMEMIAPATTAAVTIDWTAAGFVSRIAYLTGQRRQRSGLEDLMRGFRWAVVSLQCAAEVAKVAEEAVR